MTENWSAVARFLREHNTIVQDNRRYQKEDICGRELRGGRVCIMDPNHRGRCSSVGFRCDGCGKMRRSTPYTQDHEEGLAFCFMCASPQANPDPIPDLY